MTDNPELAAMSAGLTQSLQRRLVLCAVRWLIGFGIVAAVAHFWPSAAWLWWAAAAAAGLSLVTLFATHFLVQRRIGVAQTRIAEAERMAQQVAGADRGRED
ncbi:MAG: hypothetical protein O9318_06725 [Hylemonella sp.]|uniref:hypothetical protein n=1 Tax=Hylemonella sp. TaxID=2066020 RepID=UPI0022BA9894|nr:hypothetical protein [Hylemonella sp.]MCZ8252145.1 hypothetical protein [Hylemonella sp.]